MAGERLSTICSEKGHETAREASRESAARLRNARRPVISVNGNTVVLAGEGAIRLAAVLGCPIEVNLYYRTPSRVKGLISLLEEWKFRLSEEDAPDGFYGDWKDAVEGFRSWGLS